MDLNPKAILIATNLIKQFEGLSLRSYPDPASPLYAALSTYGLLSKYMAGTLTWNALPHTFKALSGSPFTAGYGCTEGITKDTVLTQQEADSMLDGKVRQFMQSVLQASPKLANQAPERIAAITSLAFNIGMGNYRSSTVAKMIAAENWQGAAPAILMWNLAGGKIMAGLDKRRKIEAALFNSITG